MTQINLLTWREQAKQTKKKRFIFLIISTVMLAGFFIMLFHIYHKALIRHQLDRNTYLQSELGKEQAELTLLIGKKKEMTKDTTALNFIMSLRKESYQAVQLLDALSRVVPEDATLSKVVRKKNVITIFGKAKSDSQVTLLINNMSKVKVFKQPELTEISAKSNATGDERNFKLKVEQQE